MDSLAEFISNFAIQNCTYLLLTSTISSVPSVGLLTLFFGGILDLSKILLFPLQSDDDSSFSKNTSVNMDIGALIRETNAGPSQWKGGISKLPF